MTHFYKFLQALFQNQFITDWVLRKLDKKHSGKAKQKFLDSVSVYDSMNTILNETNIQRILVFRIVYDEMVGSHNRLDCIKGVFTSPFKNEMDEYQDYEVDEEYIRMLRDLYNGDIEYIEGKRSIIRGLLGDIYKANGVRYSLITRICDGKTRDKKGVLIYLSLASSFTKAESGDNGSLDSAKSRVVINNELNKIRKYYRRYYS